jgi:hypothetical protein
MNKGALGVCGLVQWHKLKKGIVKGRMGRKKSNAIIQ